MYTTPPFVKMLRANTGFLVSFILFDNILHSQVTQPLRTFSPSHIPCHCSKRLNHRPRLEIRTSVDRENWDLIGTVWAPGQDVWTDNFTLASDANIWAPDCHYIEGEFWVRAYTRAYLVIYTVFSYIMPLQASGLRTRVFFSPSPGLVFLVISASESGFICANTGRCSVPYRHLDERGSRDFLFTRE